MNHKKRLDKQTSRDYIIHMNILWHSVSPFCQSGYGSVTRFVVSRLVEAGHKVTIGTKHLQYGSFTWNGVEVVDGTNIPMMIEYSKQFDYVFTFWDIWRLEQFFPQEKWVAYVPVSSETVSDTLKDVLSHTSMQLSMSKHGERALKQAGFSPIYVPHGIDTGKFRIKQERMLRKTLGISEDTFLIGSVGWNYANDRKGFVRLTHTFKEFHDKYPNSALYIHTGPGEINLYNIAKELGIYISFPDPLSYYLNHYDEEMLCDVYNSMDVFCLPTTGEGFGLPTVEAQSCGTPVIIPANTSGPELCKTGVLIYDNLFECLEFMMNYQNNRKETRAKVAEYDQDTVWTTYWEPVLKQLAGDSPGTI